VNEAFARGFALELLKIAATAPVVPPGAQAANRWAWLKQMPGYSTGRFALHAAPLAALASLPFGITAMGLGRGLKTPATVPFPEEERY